MLLELDLLTDLDAEAMRERIEEEFERADTEGDDQISMDEFLEWYGGIQEQG